MIQCMFIYDPGGGDVEFTPTWPAIGKQPLDGLSAVAHPSISSSGLKQTVLERIDDLMTLPFPYVPLNDLAQWRAFMLWALAGNVFAYRPNAADDTVWSEYTLESDGWSPKFVCVGTFSFELKCRLWVGATMVSGS